MPAGYEAIRDRFLAKGYERKEAEKHAARIWNHFHPDNPVGRNSDSKANESEAKKE